MMMTRIPPGSRVRDMSAKMSEGYVVSVAGNIATVAWDRGGQESLAVGFLERLAAPSLNPGHAPVNDTTIPIRPEEGAPSPEPGRLAGSDSASLSEPATVPEVPR